MFEYAEMFFDRNPWCGSPIRGFEIPFEHKKGEEESVDKIKAAAKHKAQSKLDRIAAAKERAKAKKQ